MAKENEKDARAPDVEENNSFEKKVLAENIAKLRRLKKISRAELALKIGVTEAAIGQYERGERLPSIEVLCKLANFFRVTIDSLVGYGYESSFWSNVKFIEYFGFRVEVREDRQVLIYSNKDTPPNFAYSYESGNYEFGFPFKNGDSGGEIEGVLYYDDYNLLVAVFDDADHFTESIEALKKWFCHATGAKYFVSRFFFELMENYAVEISELILLERRDFAKKYFNKIKNPQYKDYYKTGH